MELLKDWTALTEKEVPTVNHIIYSYRLTYIKYYEIKMIVAAFRMERSVIIRFFHNGSVLVWISLV